MFYGWRIVGGVFLAQLFVTGFVTYSFGLFMVPLQDSFGATRAQVNLGMTLSTLMGLVLSPMLVGGGLSVAACMAWVRSTAGLPR